MKKSLKRGRPPSGGPTRIPRQFRFHPNMDRLLIEIWKREKRLCTRTVTRQEIIEKALLSYAVTYHPNMVKEFRGIRKGDEFPDLIKRFSPEEAVPA